MISTLKVIAYVTDNTYYVQNNLNYPLCVDGYLVSAAFFIDLHKMEKKIQVVAVIRDGYV